MYSRSHLTGSRGEIFASNLLTNMGAIVSMSSNPYDDKKDMIVKFGSLSFNVEVKSQAPLLKYNAFSFSESQTQKLQNVDFSILIGLKLDQSWNHMCNSASSGIGNVYKMQPNFQFRRWKDARRVSKIMIPIEQAALQVIYVLSDDELSYLSEHTFKNEKYNKNQF
jgi:hypothetical protein